MNGTLRWNGPRPRGQVYRSPAAARQPDSLAGIGSFFKKLEQTFRAPVNAVLSVVPGGKVVVAAANAGKSLITAKQKGAPVGPGTIAAAAQQVADAAKAQAGQDLATQNAALGTSLRIDPQTLMLGAAGLAALYLLTSRRRNPPRRRRSRPRRRR